jgi:hypothetical protein
MIKYFVFVLMFAISVQKNFGQASELSRKEIITVIDSFFSAMHNGDSSAIMKVVNPVASMRTVSDGKIQNTPLSTFLTAVALKPRYNKWLEKIWTYEVKTDSDLATVWTPYSFYMDTTLSHCGVNCFTLIRDKNKGWQIHNIIDTRNTKDCLREDIFTKNRREIDSLLNRWHRAASVADETTFFEGSMTKDAIYLGTDISERWLRDELKSWAKAAFDKESAWAFTPSDRKIYFNENEPTMAWFEESLKTWMGDCRGSGILILESGKWKIKHYNLAVAVPNKVVDDYLKLIGLKSRKAK